MILFLVVRNESELLFSMVFQAIIFDTKVPPKTGSYLEQIVTFDIFKCIVADFIYITFVVKTQDAYLIIMGLGKYFLISFDKIKS
jgi:hypothetical protein